MADPGNLELTSEAFSKRLANLLVATRVRDGRSVGSVARASKGAYSRHDLREFESATKVLDDATVEQVAALYGCDLAVILPERLPVVVGVNRISMGGVEAAFVPENHTALLTAYLTLVRTLRREYSAPSVALRRDDIEILSEHMGEEPTTVVERLASLMNATQSKRAAMVGLLATGAAVIGLVGTAAAVGSTSDTGVRPLPATTITTVVESTSTTGAPASSTSTTVPDTTMPSTIVIVTSVPAPTTTPVAVTTTQPVYIPPPTVAPTTSSTTTTMPAIVGTDVPLPTSTTADVGGGPPPVPTPTTSGVTPTT
ncbi:MAG: hypothetical protein WCI22_13770 [Actinomycetota bacterium]